MTKISLNIDELTAERQQLTDFLSRPDAFSDPDFAKKNRRMAELEDVIAAGMRQNELKLQIEDAKAMISSDDEMSELAKEELPLLESELAELDEKLFVMLTPKDPNDEKNVIVEI